MKVESTDLPGVVLVKPDIHGDDRGFFFEAYRASRYHEAGITADFVQDNVSYSRQGVLRGLHLQNPKGQAKLVSALRGRVFDVAVDVRVGSPHFGRWAGAILTDEHREQLLVPEGFAHGFCVLSEDALLGYKCSADYDPATELTIRFDDPEIAIDWPLLGLGEPELSKRDASAPLLAEIDPTRLPRYERRVDG